MRVYNVINSAFIVEEIITVCLMLFHNIVPLAKEKIYSDVDFRESIHP